MAYDRVLADMIRENLAHLPEVREVSMFGGLSFLVNEKMVVTANTHGDLMVHCDPDQVGELLKREGAAEAEMGRRKMSKGWLRISTEGYESEADLEFWIKTALEYNAKETSGSGVAK
jgi:TfoX/Sxy family transcriptional regulator of competence genes